MTRALQETDRSISKWFGENLAELLASKIQTVYPSFLRGEYISFVSRRVDGLSYTQRIAIHTEALHEFLPEDYKQAIEILRGILGEENPRETGMFTHFYWILPIGKYVETYGLQNCDTSLAAIEEITKRNTGEYAIRPFIRAYPQKVLKTMRIWSRSPNFHLRRLASEGLRPRLPWATKLDTFIENPEPVFTILGNLMEDEVKFVQKSVANNLRDYLKVNQQAAHSFMKRYEQSKNTHTQWILKHATR